MKQLTVYCTMAANCPEAKSRRCHKQFHPAWESYCARVRLLKDIRLELAPSPSGPSGTGSVKSDAETIHMLIDENGHDVYYRRLPGGGRIILGSHEVGYDFLEFYGISRG